MSRVLKNPVVTFCIGTLSMAGIGVATVAILFGIGWFTDNVIGWVFPLGPKSVTLNYVWHGFLYSFIVFVVVFFGGIALYVLFSLRMFPMTLGRRIVSWISSGDKQ